jgi:hypothetical protein
MLYDGFILSALMTHTQWIGSIVMMMSICLNFKKFKIQTQFVLGAQEIGLASAFVGLGCRC